MTDLRARFAAEIRVARQAAGLTQQQLAKAANTSVDFLSKLERGLESPSLETLVALTKTLSLDPARILRAELERHLTAERWTLEARAAQMVRNLDDRALLALLEIGHALRRLSAAPEARKR